MPRIRGISPEIFQNHRVCNVSLGARWLYLGLVLHADSNGICHAHPARLRRSIFPDHGFNDGHVNELLGELRTQGLIAGYRVNGEVYIWVIGFHEHQKDKYKSLKYPLPPQEVINETMEQSDLFAISGRMIRPERSTDASISSSLFLVKDSQEKTPSEGVVHKKGTRLPQDFVVPLDWIADGKAHLEKHSISGVDVELEADNFVNHWASATGSAAVKFDWRRTWLNWLVRASTFVATGRAKPKLQFDHL